MNLEDLIDNNRTDKNTTHSYIELYDTLFMEKKDAKNVLEIGISQGGSIKLWYDYFKNATVHGIDIMHESEVWTEIKDKERIILHTSQDAYDSSFVDKNFKERGIKFDVVLDDGPHTLESMKKFVELYSPLLTEEGILVIEDVQNINWIQSIAESVPIELQKFITVYDRRGIKNRYDDIVFIINKSPKNVVVITSVINCNSLISEFSSEERLKQTLYTIYSIRKYIPNSYIILSDIEIHDTLISIVDKCIFIQDTTYITAPDTKQLGDFLLFENGLKNLPNNFKIKNIFKISGRYWINETFNYIEYNNDKNCFRFTDNEIWKNTVTTCFFKISYTHLEEFITFCECIFNYFLFLIKCTNSSETIIPLKVENNIMKNTFGAAAENIIPFIIKSEPKIGMENLFYMYSSLCEEKIQHINNLGVSGYIATNGIKGSA